MPRLLQSYHSYTSPENELHLSLGYGAVLGQSWDNAGHAAMGSAGGRVVLGAVEAGEVPSMSQQLTFLHVLSSS